MENKNSGLFFQLRRHKISILISAFVIGSIYLDYNRTQEYKLKKKQQQQQ